MFGTCVQMAAFWEGLRDTEQDARTLTTMAREQGLKLIQACQKDPVNSDFLLNVLQKVILKTDLGVVVWGHLLATGQASSMNSDVVQELALQPEHTKLARLFNATGTWNQEVQIPVMCTRAGLRLWDTNMVLFSEKEHPLIGAILMGSWESAEMIWEGLDKSGRSPLLNDALLAVACHIHSKDKVNDHSALWAARLLKSGADPNHSKQASSGAVHHGKHLIFAPIDGINASPSEKENMIRMGWDMKKLSSIRGPSREIAAPIDCLMSANDLIIMNMLKIDANAAGKKWLNTWTRHWQKKTPRTVMRFYGKALDAFFWHNSDEHDIKSFLGNSKSDEGRKKHQLFKKVMEKVIPVLSQTYYHHDRTEYDPGWGAWQTTSSMLASPWHMSNGGKEILKTLIDSVPQDQYVTEKHMAMIVEGAVGGKDLRVQSFLGYGASEVKHRVNIESETIQEVLLYAIKRCEAGEREEMRQWCQALMDMIGEAKSEIMEYHQKNKGSIIRSDTTMALGDVWKKRILLFGSIPGKTIASIDERRQNIKM